MTRRINVTVTGQFVQKDTKNAGVMGEGNVTALHLTLDDTWAGYGKRVVWRDAAGENPVAVVLVPDAAAADSLDLVTAVALALYSVYSGRSIYLDISVVVALLGFVSTVFVARYLEGRL